VSPSTADRDTAGWNARAIGKILDYARSQKTTGFLIVDRGRVIAEHNWPPDDSAADFKKYFVYGMASDGALLEDVASAQKSIIAILAGIAVDKGVLEVSIPASTYLGAAWSKASPEQEALITVRDLLEMNSGLEVDLSFDSPPRTKFFYNTQAYAVLKGVLEAASGKTLDEITRLWLTDPVGMNDTSWRLRPAAFASVANPTALVTTPRDLAKIGQLILDHGTAADGSRVISREQIEAMLQPTATNPGYGRLWWLNGSAYNYAWAADARMPGSWYPIRREGQFIPAAPADLVAARGSLERWLFIVPSRKLTVVRTGQKPPDPDFEQQLWSFLMEAIPAK